MWAVWNLSPFILRCPFLLSIIFKCSTTIIEKEAFGYGPNKSIDLLQARLSSGIFFYSFVHFELKMSAR